MFPSMLVVYAFLSFVAPRQALYFLAGVHNNYKSQQGASLFASAWKLRTAARPQFYQKVAKFDFHERSARRRLLRCCHTCAKPTPTRLLLSAAESLTHARQEMNSNRANASILLECPWNLPELFQKISRLLVAPRFLFCLIPPDPSHELKCPSRLQTQITFFVTQSERVSRKKQDVKRHFISKVKLSARVFSWLSDPDLPPISTLYAGIRRW